MLHSRTAVESKEFLLSDAGEFQFFIVNDGHEVEAICRSIPTCWDGTSKDLPEGYDTARKEAVRNRKAGIPSDTLLGLSVSVPKRFRGSGISSFAIEAMKSVALAHGLERLIIPVRPSGKWKYPSIPIAEYASWKREDGLPVDPWLRRHILLGGLQDRVAEKSMTIDGDVAEWQSWTGQVFEETGKYLIDGALSLLEIDVESNHGIYYDPNIWVTYAL